jgi:hypothetical protein
MSTRAITNRLDRVAAQRAQGDVRQVAARLAEVTGIPLAELLAEALAIAQGCQAQGITTLDGMLRFQAAELGITLEELQVEVARIREQGI